MHLATLNSLNTNSGNYSNNCTKPRRKTQNFGSDEETKKVRYKHYEELDNETLALKSLLKAHRDVEQSGKMRLYKAIPAITTGLIGTTIALTQPGKLSAKAAAGLGFLALVNGASLVCDIATDKFEKSKKVQKGDLTPDEFFAKRTGIAIASTLGAAAGAFALVKTGPKVLEKVAKPAYEFLKKDIAKLSDNINSSKLGKFVESTVNPFFEKHPKTSGALAILAPLATVFGGLKAGNDLLNDMSNDIREKTSDNFLKSKMIQHIARAEFDEIDAEEV